MLGDHEFFPYEVYIDRAHRLGRRKTESAIRPRPIIVRFSYFKDKQHIIMNGRKFKGTNIGVSEDYSKQTLEVHRQLNNHAREAKEIKFSDPVKSIKHYKITYRRAVLTYSTDKTNTNARTFTRSFSLEDILKNNQWYIPQDNRRI